MNFWTASLRRRIVEDGATGVPRLFILRVKPARKTNASTGTTSCHGERESCGFFDASNLPYGTENASKVSVSSDADHVARTTRNRGKDSLLRFKRSYWTVSCRLSAKLEHSVRYEPSSLHSLPSLQDDFRVGRE